MDEKCRESVSPIKFIRTMIDCVFGLLISYLMSDFEKIRWRVAQDRLQCLGQNQREFYENLVWFFGFFAV